MEEKSRPYIVMEFLQGQTLRQVMRSVERMPVHDALAIAGRICEALEYLHGQNVIHRDLKPENIMLCNDGSIRLMDFGIAKAAGLRRLTFSGFSSSLGTPDYMAPEQVKGKRGDARTDIYSLGVMLYEMVTGALPFEGTNPYAIMHARLAGDPIAPRKWNPELSPQLEEIILHALERQPYDRYPSAAAMKAELEAPDSVPLTGRCDRLRPQAPWAHHWHSVRWIVLAILAPIRHLRPDVLLGPQSVERPVASTGTNTDATPWDFIRRKAGSPTRTILSTRLYKLRKLPVFSIVYSRLKY